MKIEAAGAEVYVYTGGEAHKPDNEAIVFIHGAGMNHTVWTLLARYWAKAGYNVVALDLPGHGLTSGEPLASIEENAEFVNAVMTELKLTDSVTVVGHSMGSLVALETALRLKNTRRLAMLGTAVPMVVGDPLLDAARANEHAAIDMISLFGHSFGSQQVFPLSFLLNVCWKAPTMVCCTQHSTRATNTKQVLKLPREFPVR